MHTIILNDKELDYLFIQLRADSMKFPQDEMIKQLRGKIKIAVDNSKNK